MSEKHERNIQKNENSSSTLQDAEKNTTTINNDHVQNKYITDLNEVMTHFDKQLSKLKIFNCQKPFTMAKGDELTTTDSSQTVRKKTDDELKFKKSIKKNTIHSKTNINNLKSETTEHAKLTDLSKSKMSTENQNQQQPLTDELNSAKSKIEQLNEQLKTITTELSNEKNNNIMLLQSYTVSLDRCKILEAEHKSLNGHSYKEKLDETVKILKKVLDEKNDLVKRLEELQIELTNANDNFIYTTKMYDKNTTEMAEKLREIEEERNGWNEYQIKLEKKISDDSQVLTRNEQYIQNQDGIIHNLTRDKHDLETRLSEESENYDEKLEKLADIIEELKGKFAMAENSYNADMIQMNNMLDEQRKIIITKDEVIEQHKKTIQLMRQITPQNGKHSDIF